MMSFGNPFEKGRKPLPEGTIREYSGMKFRKFGGKWVYAGQGEKPVEEKAPETPVVEEPQEPITLPTLTHAQDWEAATAMCVYITSKMAGREVAARQAFERVRVAVGGNAAQAWLYALQYGDPELNVNSKAILQQWYERAENVRAKAIAPAMTKQAEKEKPVAASIVPPALTPIDPELKQWYSAFSNAELVQERDKVAHRLQEASDAGSINGVELWTKYLAAADAELNSSARANQKPVWEMSEYEIKSLPYRYKLFTDLTSNAHRLSESQFVATANAIEDRKTIARGNAATTLQTTLKITKKQALALVDNLEIERTKTATWQGTNQFGDRTAGVSAQVNFVSTDALHRLLYQELKKIKKSQEKPMLILGKGRKPMPEGTIRTYGGTKFKKVAGKWVYAGDAGKKGAEGEKEKKAGPSASENEKQAQAVGSDSKQLKARLMEAVSSLSKEGRAAMGPSKDWTFDVENKRMVSPTGYALQWQLRNKPDEPESYENQQASKGAVTLRKIEKPTGESKVEEKKESPKLRKVGQAVVDQINRDAEANSLYEVAATAKELWSSLIEHADKLHPVARQAVEHYAEEVGKKAAPKKEQEYVTIGRRKVKKETAERIKKERAEEGTRRHESLVNRLEEKVKEYGKDSIWQEMLDEARGEKPSKRLSLESQREAIAGGKVSPEEVGYKTKDAAVAWLDMKIADAKELEVEVGGPSVTPPKTPKDPATMTPSEVNKELDKIEAAGSKFDDKMIAAGYGNMKWDELSKLDHPAVKKQVPLVERKWALQREVERRMGPGMYQRISTRKSQDDAGVQLYKVKVLKPTEMR